MLNIISIEYFCLRRSYMGCLYFEKKFKKYSAVNEKKFPHIIYSLKDSENPVFVIILCKNSKLRLLWCPKISKGRTTYFFSHPHYYSISYCLKIKI